MNLLETLSDIERYAAPIPQMRSYKLPGGTQPLKTWDLMAPLEPSPSCPYVRHEPMLSLHRLIKVESAIGH